jgi:hypothetical protein
MSYIMVDVEADGPIPGDYSMISFGAIIVEPSLSKTFLSVNFPLIFMRLGQRTKPAAIEH